MRKICDNCAKYQIKLINYNNNYLLKVYWYTGNVVYRNVEVQMYVSCYIEQAGCTYN